MPQGKRPRLELDDGKINVGHSGFRPSQGTCQSRSSQNLGITQTKLWKSTGQKALAPLDTLESRSSRSLSKMPESRSSRRVTHTKPAGAKSIQDVETVKRQLEEFRRMKNEKIMRELKNKLKKTASSNQLEQRIPESLPDTDYVSLLRGADVLLKENHSVRDQSSLRGSPVYFSRLRRLEEQRHKDFAAGQTADVSTKCKDTTLLVDRKPTMETSDFKELSLYTSSEAEDCDDKQQLLISNTHEESRSKEDVKRPIPCPDLGSSCQLQEVLVSEATAQASAMVKGDETVSLEVPRMNYSTQAECFYQEQTQNTGQTTSFVPAQQDRVEETNAVYERLPETTDDNEMCKNIKENDTKISDGVSSGKTNGVHKACDSDDVMFVCETPKPPKVPLAVVHLSSPERPVDCNGDLITGEESETTSLVASIEKMPNLLQEPDSKHLGGQHIANSFLNVTPQKEIKQELPPPQITHVTSHVNVAGDVLEKKPIIAESLTRNVSRHTASATPPTIVHSASAIGKTSGNAGDSAITQRNQEASSDPQKRPEPPGYQDLPHNVPVKQELDQTLLCTPVKKENPKLNSRTKPLVSTSEARSGPYKDLRKCDARVKTEDKQEVQKQISPCNTNQTARKSALSAVAEGETNGPLHSNTERSGTAHVDECPATSSIGRRVTDFKRDLYSFFEHVVNNPKNDIIMLEKMSKLMVQIQDIEQTLNSKTSQE